MKDIENKDIERFAQLLSQKRDVKKLTIKIWGINATAISDLIFN